MDFLKSAVASAIAKGPLAAYVVAEKVELDNTIWTLNNATRRDNGARCSIFTFEVAPNRNRIPIAKNAFRRFRTLRHPGVVQLIDAIETDAQLCIITERITPLASHAGQPDLQQETIKWGLYNIAKTLKFINDEAGLVHSLVRMSSIFVGESGEWKLGGFELLSSTKDEHDNVIYSYSSLVPGYAQSMPPEVAKSGWDIYRSGSWSPVDAFGMGMLISEAFSGTPTRLGQSPESEKVPLNMQQMFKRLVNVNPRLRPSVGIFLEQGKRQGGYFSTPLINFSENIDSLGLKSEGERDEFLSQLEGIQDDFPAEYAKRKILPELLKSVEFGGGGPKVLAVVLRIGTKLSDEEYDAQVTPAIVRLWSSPDRALRVYLLDNLSLMIDHLPQKIVNDKIFPNLVTGFADVAPLIREQTVKSVLVLITKLSERTINGDLLKYLAKTANDSEPGIRTNTTVCLGKIAKYLGPGTRSKVLVAAFTRSLRDPFIHARHAALMALSATVDMFTEDDCASKVLPSICPSLVDKEKMVRDQANKTLDIYIARIRKYGETLPVSVLPPTSAAGANVQPGQPQAIDGGADAGWTGWAISSFANKFTAANGQIDPSANGGTITASATPDISRPTTADSQSRNSTNVQPPKTLHRQVTETTKIAQSFIEPAVVDDSWNNDFKDEEDDGGVVDDAWGEMDEDDDTFFDASSKKAITKPVNKPTSTTSNNEQGEPDFAAWLASKQAQTNVKKGPLPKGLASSKPVAVRTVQAASTKAVPAPSTSRVANTKPVTKPTTVTKKAVVPTKTVPTKDEDDGWGDAWD